MTRVVTEKAGTVTLRTQLVSRRPLLTRKKMAVAAVARNTHTDSLVNPNLRFAHQQQRSGRQWTPSFLHPILQIAVEVIVTRLCLRTERQPVSVTSKSDWIIVFVAT